MGFALPAFDLKCNLYTETGAGPPYPGARALRLSLVVCNLQASRRAQVTSTGGTSDVGVYVNSMYLLLPPLTDVRGPVQYSSLLDAGDCVEVPAGSGRFYAVTFVDDVGKGFLNEFRFAVLQQVQTPVPLP